MNGNSFDWSRRSCLWFEENSKSGNLRLLVSLDIRFRPGSTSSSSPLLRTRFHRAQRVDASLCLQREVITAHALIRVTSHSHVAFEQTENSTKIRVSLSLCRGESSRNCYCSTSELMCPQSWSSGVASRVSVGKSGKTVGLNSTCHRECCVVFGQRSLNRDIIDCKVRISV